MRLAQFLVRLVDGLKEILEARRVVHGPKSREAVPKQLNLTLGEQAYGYNPFLRQMGAPTF